jgi:bifunctional DNase/RNase
VALVEVELARIVINETSDQQLIFLKEKGGERWFPIVIGVFEAIEINRKITDIRTPRPMTHDLLRNMLVELGGHVDRVVVDALKDATFFAKLHVTQNGGREHRIDSRPSDAIAIAVAEKAPIFVDEEVLNEVARQAE